MTDRELLYIKTIAEELNITKAAQKLRVAQPSLTQCVQKVENNLDCTLFYRKKNGLVLTEEGKLYYETACRILEIWDQFSQEIASRVHMEGGRLNIGASWYNTILILTRVLSQYQEKYPHVDVRLKENNTGDLARQLEQGQLDVVLIHQYPKEYPYQKEPEGKNFITIPLIQERLLLAAHEKFHLEPEQWTQKINLKQIQNLPLIRFSEQQRLRRIADYVLELAGVNPPTALTTYGFPSALDFADQGIGVIFLPELYARKEAESRKQLRLYSLDEALPAYWTSAACYYQSEHMSKSLRAFLQMLTCSFSH